MMEITKKNHEKLRKYSELLWDTCYSFNNLYGVDKNSLIFQEIHEKAWEEYHNLSKNLTSKEWLDNNVNLSLIKPDNYYIETKKDKYSPFGLEINLYHILNINSIKQEVEYELMTIKPGFICIYSNKYDSYNRYSNLKYLCLQVQDHILFPETKETWDQALEKYNEEIKLYKKLSENYKYGD